MDLALRGARVIIGCKNMEKGEEALKEIEELRDLSLESVHNFANKMLNSEPQLDFLVNNVKVMACDY